jgi:hypothetical protein
MKGSQELVETRPGAEAGLLQESSQLMTIDTVEAPSEPAGRTGSRASRFGNWLGGYRRSLAIYAGTRVVLLLLAIVCDAIFGSVVHGESLTRELANWDGWWYVHLATLGYPTAVSHGQTTLGFFPLYSMVIWLTGHIFFCSYVIAGMIVSTAGGAVSVMLVQRLTTDWWGPEVARKAVLLFCIFPGTVVFSMVYSEGILIPLVAGSMLALSRRRWVLAGLLAGLASGIGPDALAVIPMCAAASFVHLRRFGWQDREARRSLLAPLMAPVGALGFAGFLWVWTGNPFASYIAQHDGWHETSSPLAIPHQLVLLIHEVGFRFHWWHANLNVIIGLAGTVFLVASLKLLWRDRRAIPLEVLVFTGCMTFFMVTSWHVPPNPRLLITGFPIVLVFARWAEGRAWTRLVWVTAASLLLLSALTYVGSVLRP